MHSPIRTQATLASSPKHALPTPRKREPEPPSRASRVEITWSTPPLGGSPPSARGGHTACLADTQLLVFGGHYFGGHGAFVYLNDLHRLDLEASTWYQIPFNERDAVVPRGRYNHSALLMNGNARMFVFGGRGENGAVFRDMFFLDLAQVAWFQVQWTTDCPFARFGHGVASVDDEQMLVFGGWDGKKSMNDLWRFDTTTFTWHKPRINGKAPSPRHNHSMVAVSSELLMVYGGYSVVPEALPGYNKDIYLFDTDTSTWSRPRLTGSYPLGTFGQSVVLQNEIAFVLGGWSGTERTPLYMGDRQVRKLVNMLAREERLSSGQETTSTRTENTRRFKTTSSYVRALDVTSMQWFQVVSHGVHVPNRYGHSCTIVGTNLFLFGGWDGNRALNQLVVGEFSTES